MECNNIMPIVAAAIIIVFVVGGITSILTSAFADWLIEKIDEKKKK